MKTTLAGTLIFYALATFFRIREKVAGAPMKNHSRLSLLAAILANLVLLYLATHNTRVSAEFDLSGFLVVASLSLALTAIFIELMMQESYFSIFALPLCMVLLPVSLLVTGRITGPHFTQPWFLIHLIAAITGECFFLMAAISSLTYLFVVRKLKNKNRLKAVFMFPPLTRLDNLTYQTVISGAVLFLIGLAIGIFGNIRHFSGFSPAFKHYFSLIVLIYYAAVIVLRRPLKIAGPKLAQAALIGFALSLALIFVPGNDLHWFPEAVK